MKKSLFSCVLSELSRDNLIQKTCLWCQISSKPWETQFFNDFHRILSNFDHQKNNQKRSKMIKKIGTEFRSFLHVLKELFSNIYWHVLAPAQRAAGGSRRQAHRLRWLPVGGPPLGEFLLRNWSKIINFNKKIIIFMCFKWTFSW